MGAASSSLSQADLYALFNEVDANSSDSLDLDEVKRLCQLIWVKEGLKAALPDHVAQTVFDLLDLDGDGSITRQEFELLVEEVYADRKNLVSDATDTDNSWLGFLGLSSLVSKGEEPLESELELATEEFPVKPTKKKPRKKIEETEYNSDKDEEISASSTSPAPSVSSFFPDESIKVESDISDHPTRDQTGGWFGGITNFFKDKVSDSPKKPEEKPAVIKIDKEVEQESAPFWRRLLEVKKNEEPEMISASAVQAPVAVLPLRQFLLMHPQISVTERALRAHQSKRPVRPWPADMAPLWSPPVQKW
jgi:hypothetical protein